jgi:hypothetical protein
MEDIKTPERLTLEQAKAKFSKVDEKSGRIYGVRKAFDILIDDKPYTVYDINDYEHPNGHWNGTPKTWWLDYSDYKPVDEDDEEEGEDFQPRIRELIPYVDKGVHRICWEIRYKQKNTVKYKWDDFDVRNGGSCQIYANGKLIYSFFSRSVDFALAKAQYMMVQLLEHPYNFLEQEDNNGRKIWYYGLPATVKVGYEPGNIRVVPDYTDISPETWWKEYYIRKNPVIVQTDSESMEDKRMDDESFAETKDYGEINHGDALWDGMINWFRK